MLPMQPSVMFLGGEKAIEHTLLHTQAAGANVVYPVTYTGIPLGTAFSGRYVVVYVGAYINAAWSVSSVTLGGVTLTKLVEQGTGTGEAYNSFWGGYIPTGTSGSIVINASSTSRPIFAVYSIENLKSATPVDTAGQAGSSVTLTLDTTKGGLILAGNNFANNANTTYGGTSSPVEEYDNRYNSGLWSYAGASAKITSDGSKTVTVAGGTTGPGACAISLR